MRLAHHFHLDRTTTTLVASNLLTIVLALVEKWPVADVLWVYWGQSVIIGFFSFLRILDLRRFSTEGFRINDMPVAPTPATKRRTAVFFLFHYGFFHFIYAIFLATSYSEGGVRSLVGVVACVATFAFNHLFSYRRNRERDMTRKPNIGTVMFFPYLRIIPMHLTIIFGGLLAGNSGLLLLLFLGLKTGADVIMHMIEHAAARQDPARMGGNRTRPASVSAS